MTYISLAQAASGSRKGGFDRAAIMTLSAERSGFSGEEHGLWDRVQKLWSLSRTGDPEAIRENLHPTAFSRA